MIDDGARVSSALALIGVAVLTALHKLEKLRLLKSGSEIKNIPLILSLYLKLATDQADAIDYAYELPISIENWDLWPEYVVAYAEHHSIELSDETGVKGTTERKEKFNGFEYDDLPGKKNQIDRWGYKSAHKEFVEQYGHGRVIGGDQYLIPKMSKKERIKASYVDGKDPLAEMGPLPEGIWKF